MNETIWPFVLPLLVLNGVTTLLALKSAYHSGPSRRRQVFFIWLLPVIGAVLGLIANARHKPPAMRWSVSKARTTHYAADGVTIWSSSLAYRYQRDGHRDGDSSDAGGGAMGGGDGGGSDGGGSDGGCGGDGGGGCH